MSTNNAPKGLKKHQWAWEHLRRNEDYIGIFSLPKFSIVRRWFRQGNAICEMTPPSLVPEEADKEAYITLQKFGLSCFVNPFIPGEHFDIRWWHPEKVGVSATVSMPTFSDDGKIIEHGVDLFQLPPVYLPRRPGLTTADKIRIAKEKIDAIVKSELSLLYPGASFGSGRWELMRNLRAYDLWKKNLDGTKKLTDKEIARQIESELENFIEEGKQGGFRKRETKKNTATSGTPYKWRTSAKELIEGGYFKLLEGDIDKPIKGYPIPDEIELHKPFKFVPQ